MTLRLGNIQFSEVKEKLGYELTDGDRELWLMYHSNKADLSEKPSCFHVFEIPRCIVFKGEEAKQAILQMFTDEKLVNPVGEICVYQDE